MVAMHRTKPRLFSLGREMKEADGSGALRLDVVVVAAAAWMENLEEQQRPREAASRARRWKKYTIKSRKVRMR